MGRKEEGLCFDGWKKLGSCRKTGIKKGEIFSEQNICVKRPGDGINPMRWDEVIGQISQKDYKQDDLI